MRRDPLAVLKSHHHERGWSLLPYLLTHAIVPVRIRWYALGVDLLLWRPAFLRHAPDSLLVLEQIVPYLQHCFGAWAPTDSEELLDALTAAYREAATAASRDR